ncbi:MAG TPA: DDE-type integrase/transposase/recombinase, partial [Bryobacteraceae bacterium]
ADITYIRLRTEFVFLAVIIDRFSRKAIGWALDRTLAARVAVMALRQAIVLRQPPPGVVHHSNQGIQYACTEYVEELKANQMTPSRFFFGGVCRFSRWSQALFVTQRFQWVGVGGTPGRQEPRHKCDCRQGHCCRSQRHRVARRDAK